MVTTRSVQYAADGLVMTGHLALPDGDDRRPGVLIGHEGAGLDDVQRRRADRLAEQGYVALALDYHGGRWFTDGDEMRARVRPLLADPDRQREIGTAALQVLLDEPRTDPDAVAAIGYCAGGTLALELARSGADLKAVVAFHPSLTSVRPEDSARIRGAVLVCVGSEDPLVPPAHRDAFAAEMQAAGVDWQLLVLGAARHSFTYPHEEADEVVAFSPVHADRAWQAMMALLRERL